MKIQTVCGIAALLSGVANACTSNSDCQGHDDGTECLSTGQCGCTADSDCTAWGKSNCLSTGQCGCTSDLHCTSESWGLNHCDAAEKKCHACVTNAHCSGGTCSTSGISNQCTTDCTTDSDCQHGDDKNYKCENSYCSHGLSGCEWTDKDEEDLRARLMTGNIVGGIIGVIAVVVVSLPLCCGVTKDAKAGSCEMPKIIAGICIFVGVFTIFIPLMGVSSATEGAIDDFCNGSDCECSDKNKEDARLLIGALGFYYAYLVGGFVSAILGILAASLGCCVCCKCCGPLKDQPAAAQAPVAGTVVGAPVAGGAKDQNA